MVGAGFSRNSEPAFAGARQFPLWDGLALKMAAGIGLDKDNKPRDPLQIAQMYAATLGPAELLRLIEREVPDSERRPGPLHRRLLSLPWADVFTTNYDSLLERACAEVYERKYERILTATDIPMRRPPRLVKLHGSLGSGGPLIATLEDYRRYPITHAPFVNLVRQSVMETVFVLVGFAGDDPNFLEWTGWVRDVFGDHAPKIYLCGLLSPSPAMRALLDSRRVTPIDLSEIVVGCDPKVRHTKALDWFLAALESGKPGREIKWAPREPVKLPERSPALPPTRVYTAFSKSTNGSASGEIDADEVRSVTAVWMAQRQEYPGWHVAPDSVRDRVWHTSVHWRGILVRGIEKLPLIDRLFFARELCWRLELCLSPIFTNETDRLVEWLEAIGPLEILSESPLSASDSPSDLERLRATWAALGLHVLRTAREDLDDARYDTWRGRLLEVGRSDAVISGELHHEEALRLLNRLDFADYRQALADWRVVAKQPLEHTRLAALYAELGEQKTAVELAQTALNVLRTGERTPIIVSMEAWCCMLLDMLHWSDPTKNEEWSERIELAKEQGYNPWETVEAFREKLKKVRPDWMRGAEFKAGFDAGDIRRTVHFGSGSGTEMAAWQLLRLTERAPCPLFAGQIGLVGDIAAHAAVWIGDGAPFWSLATLLRSGASEEIVHEVFDRASVAMMAKSRIDQLFAQLMRVVRGEIDRLNPVSTRENSLGRRSLTTGLDVLSRISLRLDPLERESLLRSSMEWLISPAVIAHFELARPLDTLITRVIEASSNAELSRAVGLLIKLPLYGEAGYQPKAHDQLWPEPFNNLWGRSAFPPSVKPPDWLEIWARVVSGMKSEIPSLRRRALTRASFLHWNRWLDESEQADFGDALWARTNAATGLPESVPFSAAVVLHLPGGAKYSGANRLKRILLENKLPNWGAEGAEFNSGHVASARHWMAQLKSVFRHPGLSGPSDVVLQLDILETEDVLSRLLAWFPPAVEFLMQPRFQKAPFGGFEISPLIDDFCSALGEALLLHLPPGHRLAETAEGVFARLGAANLSVARATAGRLFQTSSTLPSIVLQLEKALISEDAQLVRSAAAGIESWRMAAHAALTPAVSSLLVRLLVARVTLRQKVALDSAIGCIARFVEADDGQIEKELETQLLLTLSQIADESEAKHLRELYVSGEIERLQIAEFLQIRTRAAMLARKMARVFEHRELKQPDVLERWRKICETDALPEMRRAWMDGVDGS